MLARDDTQARRPHSKDKLGRALNPPAAAICGQRPRRKGGRRSAIGHSLVTVGHKPQSGAVRTRIVQANVSFRLNERSEGTEESVR